MRAKPFNYILVTVVSHQRFDGCLFQSNLLNSRKSKNAILGGKIGDPLFKARLHYLVPKCC